MLAGSLIQDICNVLNSVTVAENVPCVCLFLGVVDGVKPTVVHMIF